MSEENKDNNTNEKPKYTQEELIEFQRKEIKKLAEIRDEQKKTISKLNEDSEELKKFKEQNMSESEKVLEQLKTLQSQVNEMSSYKEQIEKYKEAEKKRVESLEKKLTKEDLEIIPDGISNSQKIELIEKLIERKPRMSVDNSKINNLSGKTDETVITDTARELMRVLNKSEAQYKKGDAIRKIMESKPSRF